MKVIRTTDKSTGKTHVKTISLISNMGPTVSEHEELPSIPENSVHTIRSIDNLTDRVDHTGKYIGAVIEQIVKSNNAANSNNNGFNTGNKLISVALSANNNLSILGDMTAGCTIKNIQLHAPEGIETDATISIYNENTKEEVANIKGEYFDSSNQFADEVSITLPSDEGGYCIESSSNKFIFAAILYATR